MNFFVVGILLTTIVESKAYDYCGAGYHCPEGCCCRGGFYCCFGDIDQCEKQDTEGQVRLSRYVKCAGIGISFAFVLSVFHCICCCNACKCSSSSNKSKKQTRNSVTTGNMPIPLYAVPLHAAQPTYKSSYHRGQVVYSV
uniref:uncharacterized protein LOC120341009 isoform X2 n=1 Tax=Styela clava TaxID=7725 RepID=UPI001939814B|nr:uncharacterized protein LOC120341009 isoform X2 [Styela clava]